MPKYQSKGPRLYTHNLGDHYGNVPNVLGDDLQFIEVWGLICKSWNMLKTH